MRGGGARGGHLVIHAAGFQRRHLQCKPVKRCQCFTSEQSLAEVHFNFSSLFNLTLLNILFFKISVLKIKYASAIEFIKVIAYTVLSGQQATFPQFPVPRPPFSMQGFLLAE